MGKSLIAYFSQGGTTATVAENIAEGLRSKGHDVDLHHMNEVPTPELGGYGLLGVGLPVYYFRPPFRVMDFLRELPDLNGLPVFVFVQYGTLHGDTGTVVRNALTIKGGREVGYFKNTGADYFLGYLKRGYLFSPNNPTVLNLEAAKEFGRNVAGWVTGGNYTKPDDDRPPHGVYRLERFLTNRWFVKLMYSRVFFVRTKKCVSCGLCMKICPLKNITADENGRPLWGRHCLLCLYCEMKCPTDAIVSPVSWPLFSPFMVYNVWRARRDSAIENARVVHEKGHTRRIDNAPSCDKDI